ncbi:DMT family transporter [Salipiger mucosus]|uniref:Membrane protein, putative n=1 Tax=Salipiger mucosus DSM 16094 TaxID=1123237 RepID=S9QZN1_9RHOB|nr:DMT family transporter [Salipiger mucosus]EPX86861.1 Membrane protein, putative [Salipiger mucosus DSM 16094]
MPALSDNMRGALLMIAGMAGFTFGDACIKAIGEAMPLSQILVIRGLFASAFIAALAAALGQLRLHMSRRDWGLVLLRAVAEAGAAFFFLTALRQMPLANATALMQTTPLSVTLASALVFAEPVGWRRWSAIGVGFLGMLLIVRPGTEGFTSASMLALVAVLCVTVRDLATRRTSAAVPSLTVTLVSSLGVMVFAGSWALGQDWVPVTPRLGWLLAGATLFIIGGYSFSVLVMRVGDVGFIAPFRYTGLVWALILGLVIFGDWPHPLTLVGAAVIAGTGLFTLWRERRSRRLQAKTLRT